MCLPSGDHASARIQLLCPRYVVVFNLLRIFHNCTSRQKPTARYLPSGDHASALDQYEASCELKIVFPVIASHTCTELFVPPPLFEAMYLLSGDHANA